jgi:acetylornithine deacetylase/succinyl-diaminopimelate desuccinylase-like protein
LANFASAFFELQGALAVDFSHSEPKVLASCVDDIWENSVMGALASYVGVRCLSPDFDPAWAENGEIGRAARLLSEWAASRPLPGCVVEVVEHEGLTPAIIADVPATPGAKTRLVTLLYGHLDKQPPLGSWREGLDPFVAVREGERLYGRGTADDGYSIFAAIGALEALQATGTPHGRCVVLIEASEESGSPHLAPYLEDVAARIGGPGPGLVVCLDSGCASYDRLWNTTSLRGLLVATLTVEVLSVGVHSGLAGGVVPESFRILRQLLSRVEDEETGELLVPECLAEPPARYRTAAETMVAELGEAALSEFPTVPSLELSGRTPVDRLLRRTWMPSLAVTGIDGLPSVKDGGNVLRPFTTLKIALRLPPSVDPDRAGEAVVRALSADPPQGARVKAVVVSASPGFDAPPQPEWLARAVDEASQALFGRGAGAMSEGGTIPFMAELATRFPKAQFLVTGVLGPDSNAHGPNEMLDLVTARRVTAAVAHVLASAP